MIRSFWYQITVPVAQWGLQSHWISAVCACIKQWNFNWFLSNDNSMGFYLEFPSLKKMSNHPFKLLNDRLDEIRSWIESSATKFNKTPSDFLWKMMESLYNVIPVSISIPLTSEEKKAPSCSIPKTYHDKGLETYSENLSFQASQGDVLFWSPPFCPYPLASNSANLSFFMSFPCFSLHQNLRSRGIR